MVAFTFPAVELTEAAVPLIRERSSGVVIFARAKFANEADRLRQLDVQVIHDEYESAGAMIRAAMGAYQRTDLNSNEVGEILAEWDGKK
jgi:hypothetical protein